MLVRVETPACWRIAALLHQARQVRAAAATRCSINLPAVCDEAGPFAVHEVEGVKIGMNICYDGGFPEPARCLTLLGADLIVLPTNWPPGAEPAAEYAINTRAMENTVYYAAVNRIGVERGTPFIGRSRICDPLGKTLATADGVEEVILYADIDVARSRNKHLIRQAGTNEVNRIADRHPEMYGVLVESHSLQRPRDR